MGKTDGSTEAVVGVDQKGTSYGLKRSDGLSSGGLKLTTSSVPKHLVKVTIGGITIRCCMWLWSPSALPATRANTSNKQEDRSHSFK